MTYTEKLVSEIPTNSCNPRIWIKGDQPVSLSVDRIQRVIIDTKNNIVKVNTPDFSFSIHLRMVVVDRSSTS